MRRFFASLPRRLFLVGMLAGCALIAAASLVYFDFETLPPFAIEKLPVRFETLWLVSLRLHVASALVTFPLCLLLATRTLQRRLTLHRWLGRATGVLVLLALVPSGVVLSFDAKGGPVVTAGFLLSAGIVAGAMVLGTLAARRRELVAHRRAMRHVVAQMSVAVTSRALLMALDARGIDPDIAYVVALWLPVLGSAAAVEIMSLRAPWVWRSWSIIQERVRRVAISSFASVRPRGVESSVARLGR
jgi:hypothetical protein